MGLDKVDVACLQTLNEEMEPIEVGDLCDGMNEKCGFLISAGLVYESFDKLIDSGCMLRDTK